MRLRRGRNPAQHHSRPNLLGVVGGQGLVLKRLLVVPQAWDVAMLISSLKG